MFVGHEAALHNRRVGHDSDQPCRARRRRTAPPENGIPGLSWVISRLEDDWRIWTWKNHRAI